MAVWCIYGSGENLERELNRIYAIRSEGGEKLPVTVCLITFNEALSADGADRWKE